MKVIELVEEMRNICETLRKEGRRIRFVPTMGALHIGHASLIKSANEDQNDEDVRMKQGKEQEDDSAKSGQNKLVVSDNQNERLHDDDAAADHRIQQQQQSNRSAREQAEEEKKSAATSRNIVVIVSIFLNPKQFNNPADYVNYPNTRGADLELCKRLNVDYIFAPTLKQIYPAHGEFSEIRTTTVLGATDNNVIQCMVAPPDRLADDLEGKSRPGHFRGMLTVVCKLFNIIRPHEAYFGEKDYQQLVLVTHMSRELNMDVNIRPVETVRDHDLLPLSSRNVRLSESQRQVAPVMYKILIDAKQALDELDSTLNSYNILSAIENKCTNISSILTASMLATLCLNIDEDHAQMFDIDYLELRCAKDVSKVHFERDLDLFDCQLGCVKRQLKTGYNVTLKARILISVIVGKVRLLDNIGISLNRCNKESN